MLNATQLEQVMIETLKCFDTRKQSINRDTVHNSVLSTQDGFRTASSSKLYKGVIRIVLKNSGNQDKPWPAKWMTWDVKTLAPQIV
jgi:hypothetical protein